MNLTILYLTRFNFVLHYCPGKSIGKPDVLSCQPDYEDGLHNNENVVLLKPQFLALQMIEEIVFEGEEWALLTDIWRDYKLGHQESIARAARELWQLSVKFIHSSEWSEVDSLLLFHSKIYVPDIYNLCKCIVSLHHNIN